MKFLLIVLLIAIFSESVLATCLPVTKKNQYYHIHYRVPVVIDFFEKKGGVTGQYFQSINSYYNSRVEIFMDDRLDNLCINLGKDKVYVVPMSSVSITGGFRKGKNLDIKDLFEFLNFKSGNYVGYSYINYYRNTNGGFLSVQFIGYGIGFEPGVEINIRGIAASY